MTFNSLITIYFVLLLLCTNSIGKTLDISDFTFHYTTYHYIFEPLSTKTKSIYNSDIQTNITIHYGSTVTLILENNQNIFEFDILNDNKWNEISIISSINDYNTNNVEYLKPFKMSNSPESSELYSLLNPPKPPKSKLKSKRSLLNVYNNMDNIYDIYDDNNGIYYYYNNDRFLGGLGGLFGGGGGGMLGGLLGGGGGGGLGGIMGSIGGLFGGGGGRRQQAQMAPRYMPPPPVSVAMLPPSPHKGVINALRMQIEHNNQVIQNMMDDMRHPTKSRILNADMVRRNFDGVEDGNNWIGAEWDCRKSRRGHLAAIRNSANNLLVKEECNKMNRHWACWIGLRRPFNRWTDGSGVTYSSWQPGEPDNGGGFEACVEIYHTGRWNDLQCSHKRPSICETITHGLKAAIDFCRKHKAGGEGGCGKGGCHSSYGCGSKGCGGGSGCSSTGGHDEDYYYEKMKRRMRERRRRRRFRRRQRRSMQKLRLLKERLMRHQIRRAERRHHRQKETYKLLANYLSKRDTLYPEKITSKKRDQSYYDSADSYYEPLPKPAGGDAAAAAGGKTAAGATGAGAAGQTPATQTGVDPTAEQLKAALGQGTAQTGQAGQTAAVAQQSAQAAQLAQALGVGRRLISNEEYVDVDVDEEEEDIIFIDMIQRCVIIDNININYEICINYNIGDQFVSMDIKFVNSKIFKNEPISHKYRDIMDIKQPHYSDYKIFDHPLHDIEFDNYVMFDPIESNLGYSIYKYELMDWHTFHHHNNNDNNKHNKFEYGQFDNFHNYIHYFNEYELMYNNNNNNNNKIECSSKLNDLPFRMCLSSTNSTDISVYFSADNSDPNDDLDINAGYSFQMKEFIDNKFENNKFYFNNDNDWDEINTIILKKNIKWTKKCNYRIPIAKLCIEQFSPHTNRASIRFQSKNKLIIH